MLMLQIWVNQDQAILSWLFAALTQCHSQVLDCTLSHEVWTRLKNNYNATTKSYLLQLKTYLIQLKKGPESMLPLKFQ